MQKSMLALMTLALLTSGCATAVFDKRACPVERSYSRQQQIAIADELKSAGPAIKGAMTDYLKLRDKVRACRGQK
jgi:hypothetical protein